MVALCTERLKADPGSCHLINSCPCGTHPLAGTNAVWRMLLNNIDAASFGKVRGGVTKAKHNVQSLPSNLDPYKGTLVIVTARNPYDWLIAMHTLCYCCNDMPQLEMERFLQAPYSHYTEVSSNCPLDLQPDGNNFTTIPAMRRVKYEHWLSMKQWTASLEFVHVEDLFDAEALTAWFRKIAQKYCLPVNAVTQPLSTDARKWLSTQSFDAAERRGKSVYLNHTRWQMDNSLKAVMHLVNQYVDWEFEAKLGFKKVDIPVG
jgi:hypothetical protein